MGVVVWVDAGDCDPPHGLDMDSAHDADKVAMLVDAFQNHGFDRNRAALIGYPLNGRIQLLSGTHRHRAATIAGIKLPVVFWLNSTIEGSWGVIEEWIKVMEDLPVNRLETWTRRDVEEHSLNKDFYACISMR